MIGLVKKLNPKLVRLIALFGIISVIAAAEAKAASIKEWNDGTVVSTSVVSTSAYLAFSGKGLLDGVVFTTAPLVTTGPMFVEIRDSNTANVSNAINGNFKLAVYNSTGQPTAGSPAGVFLFPRPIRLYNGLSVNANACPSGSNFCFSVLYRTVDDN